MAPVNLAAAAAATNDINYLSNGTNPSINGTKPIILHLGDPIQFNPEIYTRLKSRSTIIRPDTSDRHRDQFIKHLKDRTWGNFSAIMRPFWNTGGEMGNWDKELIDLLPSSMRVMASAGAGYDWIDAKTLGQRGTIYTNGAGASTESVADMALWLIISVFRQMTVSALAARSDNPNDFQKAHRNTMFTSYNPNGRTLGIVGFGNIGFAIAKKMRRACEMQILYYDIEQKPAAREREVDATYCPSLKMLLENSECVLLASPGGPPILNAERLAYMKPGSRVVNIARGSLIDEEALADALDSGHISAAALDVHTNEPRPNPRLIRESVALTCHTGGASVETTTGFERLAMENVEAVLSGREPLTAVNLQHLRRDNVNGGCNGHTNGHHHP